MTFILLVAGFGLTVIIFSYALFGRRFGRFYTVADLACEARPTDLDAFLNLVDSEEENYLRSVLNPSDFALVHRSRMAAAITYVFNVMHNAGIILALGEAAQRHEDREVAELGKDLANNAIRLRINGYAALYRLGISYLRPSTVPAVASVIQRYRAIERSIRALCEIQAPADVSRILAAL